MDLDDVLKPYLNNFRRLFYRQTEQGEERLSIVKLALVGAYLLANLFAFLQFSTVSEPVLQMNPTQVEVVSPSESLQEESALDYQIPMTIYGTFAHYLNFVVLIGALFFIITQDKPLSVIAQQLREFTSQSRLYLIGLILGVGMVSVLTLAGLWSYDLPDIAMYFSYEMGTGMNYVWWLLQPVLFLGGSLLLINTYMQIDKSFKARFGDLSNPTKKTAILLMVDFLIIVIFFGIAETIFHVTLATGENLGSITRVAGVGFYETTIFWLLIHFIILITFTMLNVLILFYIYVMRRLRSVKALILGILFVIVVLIGLILLKLNPPPISIKLQLILLFIFVILCYGVPLLIGFVLYKLKRSREYLNSRTALIPWILFAGMLLTVIKVAPGIFAMEGRIKSLSNWLDVLGLLFILFLGIVRVTIVSERPELEKITDSRNPIKWIKRIRIPAYSRVLILFYLAFIGFYLTLETHTISVILNIQNDFRVLRLQILAFTSSFGFLYVFWRYKPLKGQKAPPFTG